MFRIVRKEGIISGLQIKDKQTGQYFEIPNVRSFSFSASVDNIVEIDIKMFGTLGSEIEFIDEPLVPVEKGFEIRLPRYNPDSTTLIMTSTDNYRPLVGYLSTSSGLSTLAIDTKAFDAAEVKRKERSFMDRYEVTIDAVNAKSFAEKMKDSEYDDLFKIK